MNKILVSLLLTLGLTGLAQAEGDAAAGQMKALVCTACHGPDGNGIAPNFPKLASQGQPYLFKQMMDIKEGRRVVLEMTGQLTNLNEQDLRDIAAFFSNLKVSVGAADPELVSRGEALYRGGRLADGLPACTGCHAPDGVGNYSAKYPHLSGQSSVYVTKQLTSFREGDRLNDPDQMMQQIAAKLSNKDIQALSSYIEGLH